MHLQESGEMYLETILILSRKSQFVRSIDISEYMGFSKPSVSRGVGILKQGGYLTVDANGFLELTDAGTEVAKKIYERHTVLTEMLVKMGVSEKLRLRTHAKSSMSFQTKRLAASKKLSANNHGIYLKRNSANNRIALFCA